MRSITIHNLDDELMEKIERMSRETGMSLNKTIKRLLSQVLLGPEDKIGERRHSLAEFSGIWSEEESAAIKEYVNENRKVDMGDWK